MTDADYVKSIPDEELRTRISGFLMREGWMLACDAMERANELLTRDMEVSA